MGWALAHKGKASEVTYNPDDTPSAYYNPFVHARINMYTEVGRQVHGQDWDPSAHDLDGELIMKVGGGKKHDRYFIARAPWTRPLPHSLLDSSQDHGQWPTHTPKAIRGRAPSTGT